MGGDRRPARRRHARGPHQACGRAGRAPRDVRRARGCRPPRPPRSDPAARGSRPSRTIASVAIPAGPRPATVGEGGLRRRQIVGRERGQTAVVAHVVGDRRRVERGRLQERSDRPGVAAVVDHLHRPREVAKGWRDGVAGRRGEPVTRELGRHRIVRGRAQAGNARRGRLLALRPGAGAECDHDRRDTRQTRNAGALAGARRAGRRHHAGVLTLTAEVRAWAAR